MTFTTHELTDNPEATANAMWQAHLAKYGNPFQLLLAAADLPIQEVATDDPTVVMRLAASPPVEFVRPIPHNATAWAVVARKTESGWVVLWIVPLYQKGPSDLWLLDRRVSDAEFREVA